MSRDNERILGFALKKVPSSQRKVIAMGQKRNSSAVVIPQAVKALMEIETGDWLEYYHIPGSRLMVLKKHYPGSAE